jgi:translation elongation factor EF-4
VSAKLGTGVEDVLKAIVNRLPPPPVNRDAPFRALLFDSWYDRYRGAVILVYVTDGTVQVGEEIVLMHSGKNYEIKSIGLLRPYEEPTDKLYVLSITLFKSHAKHNWVFILFYQLMHNIWVYLLKSN